MVTGLQEVDGEKYFFADNGAMQTGWQDVNGVQFYFLADGKMARNTSVTVDGVTYTFGEDGAVTSTSEEPKETEKPAETKPEETSKATEPEATKPADPTNPATGDPTDMAMFTVLTLAALAGAAAVLTLMKKRQVR